MLRRIFFPWSYVALIDHGLMDYMQFTWRLLMLAVVLLALFICALMHGWRGRTERSCCLPRLSFAIGKGALAAVTAVVCPKKAA